MGSNKLPGAWFPVPFRIGRTSLLLLSHTREFICARRLYLLVLAHHKPLSVCFVLTSTYAHAPALQTNDLTLKDLPVLGPRVARWRSCLLACKGLQIHGMVPTICLCIYSSWSTWCIHKVWRNCHIDYIYIYCPFQVGISAKLNVIL